MMNNWRDFIGQQESLSKHCEHTIKNNLRKNMQLQQMQMGFSVGNSTRCLVERPAADGARISAKDDSHMQPSTRMQ